MFTPAKSKSIEELPRLSDIPPEALAPITSSGRLPEFLAAYQSVADARQRLAEASRRREALERTVSEWRSARRTIRRCDAETARLARRFFARTGGEGAMSRSSQGPWFFKQKNTWYCNFEKKRRTLHVKGFENLAEAERRWRLLMGGGVEPVALQSDGIDSRNVQKYSPKPAKVTTLGDALPTWLAFLEAKKRKPTTRATYAQHLNEFVRHVGAGTPVASVDSGAVEKWLGGMTCNDNSKAAKLASVSSFFGWLAKSKNGKMVAVNPCSDVERPTTTARDEDAMMTQGDYMRLLESASEPLRVLMRVLRGTGARPGEVCSIAGKSFNGKSVRLKVWKNDRTGKERFIPLDAKMVELLSGLKEKHGDGPLLFSGAGVPWTARNVTVALGRLRKRVGGRGVAYDLRHMWITEKLMDGMDVAKVAKAAGTSVAMIERHYGHLTKHADELCAEVESSRAKREAERK